MWLTQSETADIQLSCIVTWQDIFVTHSYGVFSSRGPGVLAVVTVVFCTIMSSLCPDFLVFIAMTIVLTNSSNWALAAVYL